MVTTLALECSSLQGSVALVNSEGTLASITWKRQRSHGELITSSIQQALNMAQISLKNVDFLSTSNGPGSFTGIRVGLSAVKSLAYANDLTVMVYDSLSILARSAPASFKDVICLQNAYSNLLFFGKYSRTDQALEEIVFPKLIEIKDLNRLISSPSLVLGEGYRIVKDRIPEELHKLLIREPSLSDFPSAAVLGRVAINDFRPERTKNWKELQALYVRASAAEEKLKKGLLKPIS